MHFSSLQLLSAPLEVILTIVVHSSVNVDCLQITLDKLHVATGSLSLAIFGIFHLIDIFEYEERHLSFLSLPMWQGDFTINYHASI